ncbi:histidine kinase dimerization/phosphoacceptor domain -containing protein [Chitinophaga sp. S165]|uniref:tetratricopeptide repeat-containing sensor histidine kinase n=1 Tax=Chitinophaga sp. S165 TaxID=2135462 RepID=UPI001304D5D6|nr:histidine kinase dimerization/phosphoacceptor domain -containing protein [Chitinophaga sp. S165]
MNRLLLLFYCIISCVVPGLAQERMPSLTALQQALNKEFSDTADVRILIAAGDAYVMRRGTIDGDIDSAKLCAEKVLETALKTGRRVWEGQSYLLYAKLWREKDDRVKGKEYVLKAEAIFEKDKAKEYLADAYIELAEYYSKWDDTSLKARIRYYRDAAGIYEAQKLKFKQAETLKRLGDYYIVLPDYNEAKNMLLRSLALFKEVKYKELQGVYDLLGAACNQLGDLDNALKYALLSVKTAEELKDSTAQLSTSYNRLGLIYYNLDDKPKAVKCQSKALKVSIKLKDTSSIQILTGNLAHAYLKLKRPEEALKLMKWVERNYPAKELHLKAWMAECMLASYCVLGQYDLARPYAQSVEKARLGLPPHDPFDEQLFGPLGLYYLGIHQSREAHHFGSLLLNAAKKNGQQQLQASAYALLYKADSSKGKYQEALEHFRMFKVMNDSVFSDAKMRQISRLQVQYETEQKDQALKLKEQNIALLTREAQLQKAELRSTRFTRNVIIAGACMLVALLLLGYNRYQLKLRSNRQLKQQQDEINRKNLSLEELILSQNKLLDEKEWLLKEIHHRVKNNLQIVMSLLNTQAAFLGDKDALNVIRESRYRMQAISLIHQKLYQSENMALIDMRAYIRELVLYLKDGFLDVNKIKFELDIAPVKLDVSQSVPIGLILNEAITNAIKYAFTGSGTIIISLQSSDAGYLTLVIADNGNGFRDDEVPAQQGSMGMMLMNTLAEQLDGTLSICSNRGVTITVRFKYEEEEGRADPLVCEERTRVYV